ncbi:MAG: 50S ribosomal protein L30 [Deltaproteobacteria bacterium]|nr:50S ribosomal protein L30 [Deltaproteobacteria bacterium]
MKKLKITYVKSIIHGTRVQRETVRSLGFRKLRDSRIVEDSPVVRGMVARVSHLVALEEVES